MNCTVTAVRRDSETGYDGAMARHRRRRNRTEAPPPDPLPLTLRDVYLVTNESEGRLAVDGLGLVIDDGGLTVLAPHGAVAAALSWPELVFLRTLGPTSAPGGETAVVLEAGSAERIHRFLVPTEDPSDLEALVASLMGVPVAREPSRSRRRP